MSESSRAIQRGAFTPFLHKERKMSNHIIKWGVCFIIGLAVALLVWGIR
ncbi:MAG: hypothetical protein IJ727_02985 [Treponema sp.]|nr:hypothetical protein [Treponema sp.]